MENEWRELYYSLLGLVRNTIREGSSAKTRIDQIERIVEDSIKKSRELAAFETTKES